MKFVAFLLMVFTFGGVVATFGGVVAFLHKFIVSVAHVLL